MPDYEKAAELLIDKVDKLREQIVELKAENKKLKRRLKKCICPHCGFGFEQALN